MKITNQYGPWDQDLHPVPPIIERPRCPKCSKPRMPVRNPDGTWTWRGAGYFCSHRCASQYADEKIQQRLTRDRTGTRQGLEPWKPTRVLQM